MSYTILRTGKTYDENVAEINSLTVDETLLALNDRLYPGEQYIHSDADNRTYATMIFDEMAKPDLSIYEAELVNYKIEQIALLTSWFDEMQAKEDAKTRAQGIADKKKKREWGFQVIDLMNYLNSLKNITQAELLALRDHAEINTAKWLLETGSLQTARTTIENMDITGIVVTEADRTEILAEIDAYVG